MDIIGQLPLEISRQIVGYLEVKDLGRCLGVSKAWRDVANDDILWKKHCNYYEAPEVPDEPIYVGQQLCYWALVWQAFVNSRAYNWYSQGFKTLDPINGDYSSISLFGSQFATYSKSSNTLDIFEVVKNSNKAKLLKSEALLLPQDDVEVEVCVSADYIVLTKYNMVFVFTQKDSGYDLYKIFAVDYESMVHTSSDFANFTKSKLNLSRRCGIYGIIEDSLFLSLWEKTIIVNFETDNLLNIYTFIDSKIQANMFTTWSENDLRIYTKEGKIALMMENVTWIKEVQTNDTLLVILHIVARTSQNHDRMFYEKVVKVWNFASRKNIFTMNLAKLSIIKVHPTQEVLVTLDLSNYPRIRRLSVWDVVNGNYLWRFEPNTFCQTPVIELHIVCKMYIVIFAAGVQWPKFYLINCASGKILYGANRLKSSYSTKDFLNDSIWVTKTGERQLLVRSFL